MYIGLTKTGQRLVLRKPLHLWWKRGICLQRQLSSSPASLNWRNETPPGGLTEIFVYKPESQIAWPDSTLGIFAQADPKFVLPGNVGVLANEADGLTTFKENTQWAISLVFVRPHCTLQISLCIRCKAKKK